LIRKCTIVSSKRFKTPTRKTLRTKWRGNRTLPVGFDKRSALSTFNRQLCIALAAADADVTCLAIAPSEREIAEAAALRVRLVPARATPGVDEREWLARRPAILAPDYKPDFVIGHGRITGPAAVRLADVFPGAKRLHFLHMAPDEIEWHKFDREVPAGQRAEDRTKIELDLAHTADRAVAVGPRLHKRFLRDLHSFDTPEPLRFDPGFDATADADRALPPGAPWKVLMLGRAEDEKLKGIDIAAAALGRIVQRRAHGLPGIELVVRGQRQQTQMGCGPGCRSGRAPRVCMSPSGGIPRIRRPSLGTCNHRALS
jgi:hypothetical protein